jgi:SNF2 family DNA or RNA helicase
VGARPRPTYRRFRQDAGADCSLASRLRDTACCAPAALELEALRAGGALLPLIEQFGSSQLWVPDLGQLIADSGKMRVLDRLLARLKAEGHRVLCYSQMTKMIDILEDYLTFRNYRYIRLDGSSKLSERRDMVEDFQTK